MTFVVIDDEHGRQRHAGADITGELVHGQDVVNRRPSPACRRSERSRTRKNSLSLVRARREIRGVVRHRGDRACRHYATTDPAAVRRRTRRACADHQRVSDHARPQLLAGSASVPARRSPCPAVSRARPQRVPAGQPCPPSAWPDLSLPGAGPIRGSCRARLPAPAPAALDRPSPLGLPQPRAGRGAALPGIGPCVSAVRIGVGLLAARRRGLRATRVRPTPYAGQPALAVSLPAVTAPAVGRARCQPTAPSAWPPPSPRPVSPPLLGRLVLACLGPRPFRPAAFAWSGLGCV